MLGVLVGLQNTTIVGWDSGAAKQPQILVHVKWDLVFQVVDRERFVSQRVDEPQGGACQLAAAVDPVAHAGDGVVLDHDEGV